MACSLGEDEEGAAWETRLQADEEGAAQEPRGGLWAEASNSAPPSPTHQGSRQVLRNIGE